MRGAAQHDVARLGSSLFPLCLRVQMQVTERSRRTVARCGRRIVRCGVLRFPELPRTQRHRGTEELPSVPSIAFGPIGGSTTDAKSFSKKVCCW